MSNLDLAKEQGNQAATNVIDAAKAQEVQLEIQFAEEQGNQATTLLADGLAGSDAYEAIKQQGSQAMPLIVFSLNNPSVNTDFKLLEFSIGETKVPHYNYENNRYVIGLYGILKSNKALPDFDKITIDNTQYQMVPYIPGEIGTTDVYYELYTELISSQETLDYIKAFTGDIDIQIGDYFISISGELYDESLQLSGDVPMTLYAGTDNWSATLYKYISRGSVYCNIDTNDSQTAYEITVYTENCYNPQVKINDANWVNYDENNKPYFYMPGTYSLKLIAHDIYGSVIENEYTWIISCGVYAVEADSIENPSHMYAGALVRITYGDIVGRDDVYLKYKIDDATDWSSVLAQNTSSGYVAQFETGWGQHELQLIVEVSGQDVTETYTRPVNSVPMTPNFVDYLVRDNITYAMLRFGRNYPGMNTVETIEYWLGGINPWLNAVHDVETNSELAELTQSGIFTMYFRTKLVSDETVTSETVTTEIQLQSSADRE